MLVIAAVLAASGAHAETTWPAQQAWGAQENGSARESWSTQEGWPAQVDSSATEGSAPSLWEARARLHAGAAYTPRATDPLTPSLLYGAAFTGWSVRGGTGAARRMQPWLRLVGDIGLGRTQVEGFAQRGDLRREIRFSLTTLDLSMAAEAFQPVGPIEVRGQIGAGPRVGVSARARERRFGFDDDSEGLPIRVGLAIPAFFELGVAVDAGAVRLPLGFRFSRNLNYPSSTAGRLDGDLSRGETGRYLVETAWQFLLVVGVDY